MEDKKKRSTNFAPREINLFMNCLIPALKIIENKQSDGASLKEKKDAWKRVYTKFIAPNDQVRDLQCLKLKYDNIKRNLKKKISQNKIEIKKQAEDHRKRQNLPGMKNNFIRYCILA